MSDYKILLKKEMKDLFSFFRKKQKKRDIIGTIFSLILTLIFVVAIVFTFGEIVKVYVNINFNGDINRLARTEEILTLVYAGIIILNTIAGIRKINNNILESSDFTVLVRLPIRNQAIFLSKFLSLLISQIILSTLTILAFNIAIAMCVNVDSLFFVRMIIVIIILPCISMLFSSLLALGVHYVIRYLRSKFILIVVIFIALLGSGFYLYSGLLTIIKALLQSDTIKFFFNVGTVRKIQTLTSFLYPANMLSSIGIGKNVLLYSIILVLFCALSLFIVSIIVMKMLNMVIKKGNEGKGNNQFYKKSTVKNSNVVGGLLKKEFIHVLRTPSYSFQYFCTSAILPLMVYCCVSLFKEFVGKLIGESFQINFELVIFIITMFNVLTNTFCATNVSREGTMFNIEKTLPITSKQFIYSKIIFCSITAAVSIFASCVVVLLTGYITIIEALITFVIVMLISLAEIFFATRKDLNYPSFADNEENEIKESGKTISIMIILAMALSLIMGCLSLGLQLLKGFGKIAVNMDNNTFGIIIKIILIVMASLITLIMYLYLNRKLDKKYYDTVG